MAARETRCGGGGDVHALRGRAPDRDGEEGRDVFLDDFGLVRLPFRAGRDGDGGDFGQDGQFLLHVRIRFDVWITECLSAKGYLKGRGDLHFLGRMPRRDGRRERTCACSRGVPLPWG